MKIGDIVKLKYLPAILHEVVGLDGLFLVTRDLETKSEKLVFHSEIIIDNKETLNHKINKILEDETL